MPYKKNNVDQLNIGRYVKKIIIYIIVLLFLFVSIAFMTTITSAERFSSAKLTDFTKRIESSTFLWLMGMEGKAYRDAFPDDMEVPKLSSISFQLATSIKPRNPRSLLGNELPGFSIFDHDVLMAEEDSYHTTHPMESAPSLEEILKDREAVVDGSEDDEEEPDDKELENSTGDREVVYIYNSHNTESFLPHLPDVDNPNLAHHNEVNITKVSERLAKSLRGEGIGTNVDDTNIVNILHDKGWELGRAYEASRSVVREAIAGNEHIQYVFDLHRDSATKDKTTVDINGESYARIMIVIGADHNNYKANLALANEFHDVLEEKYPGITRDNGVNTKQGAGTNGVFNQDLSENALLFEMGGVENNLDELYRTADALAEVFSEFYWDAEKVQAEGGGS